MVLSYGKMTISKMCILYNINHCSGFLLAWCQSVAQTIFVLLPPHTPLLLFFMFVEDKCCLRKLSVIVFELICFFWFPKAIVLLWLLHFLQSSKVNTSFNINQSFMLHLTLGGKVVHKCILPDTDRALSVQA